jgi:hypothetical protein
MNQTARHLGWIAGVLAGLTTSLGRAEEPLADSAQAKALQAVYLADANEYHFFADADHKTELTREPKPVLHWASPNDWSGDLFVWTHQGRPELIGCILSGPSSAGKRLFFHEFHALTLGVLPPHSMARGREWAPNEVGLKFTDIPGAPLPAETEKSRLVQMRSLARDFVSHTHFDGSEWELRLLPQPMHRYQRPARDPSPDWLDGALFTYVLTTGTDAEVLLIIEARQVGDEFRWQYAPARITNRPAWMLHQGKEIWRVEGFTEPSGPNPSHYTTFFAGDRVTEEAKPAESPR